MWASPLFVCAASYQHFRLLYITFITLVSRASYSKKTFFKLSNPAFRLAAVPFLVFLL